MSNSITRLDASLAAKGEDIVLRRLIGGVLKSVTVRAHVRNFHLSASDIVSGSSKLPFVVIMSLTQIRAADWPVGAPAPGAPPFNVDLAIAVIGDTVVIKGVVRTVPAKGLLHDPLPTVDIQNEKGTLCRAVQ